jgi:hypothetical protein
LTRTLVEDAVKITTLAGARGYPRKTIVIEIVIDKK